MVETCSHGSYCSCSSAELHIRVLDLFDADIADVIMVIANP